MEQGTGEKKDLKRFLRPVAIGVAVAIVLVVIVLSIQSRMQALKAKPGVAPTAQSQTSKTPEVHKPEPKAEEPQIGEIRREPSHPAPSYTLPGSRTQSAQRGQVQQKIEPSIPGSVEKPVPGEAVKEPSPPTKPGAPGVPSPRRYLLGFLARFLVQQHCMKENMKGFSYRKLIPLLVLLL